jgi:TPR repeat protein
MLVDGRAKVDGDENAPRWIAAAAANGLTSALDWLRSAAAAGDHEAQYRLSGLLSSGKGVETDADKALALLRYSAEGGVTTAQLAFAKRLATGDGVSQDYVAAHKWANLAAISGGEEAIKMRETFANLMTPDQVADAQRQARAWIAKKKNMQAD